MNRQLLATALAYALSVQSLVCTLTWALTGHGFWGWLAAAAGVGSVILVAWLWSQPLPHERGRTDDRH